MSRVLLEHFVRASAALRAHHRTSDRRSRPPLHDLFDRSPPTLTLKPTHAVVVDRCDPRVALLDRCAAARGGPKWAQHRAKDARFRFGRHRAEFGHIWASSTGVGRILASHRPALRDFMWPSFRNAD